MASYKLIENAELNLIRIHQRGVLEFGEQRANKYYWAFFDRYLRWTKGKEITCFFVDSVDEAKATARTNKPLA